MGKINLRDKIIILEGMDSSGKTALAKDIATNYDLDFIDTDWKNVDYQSTTGFSPKPYFDGLNLATAQFFKSSKGFVKPRYSISEYVYSKYYKRTSLLTQEEMESVILTKGIIFWIDIDIDKYFEIHHEHKKNEVMLLNSQFDEQRKLFQEGFERCRVSNKYQIFNFSTYSRLKSIVFHRLDIIKSYSER